uniref:Uncharacterized protein n=1 Tax=Plectus sambesii TaxID=2011161 RepID=A0A914WHA1_9BILA
MSQAMWLFSSMIAARSVSLAIVLALKVAIDRDSLLVLVLVPFSGLLPEILAAPRLQPDRPAAANIPFEGIWDGRHGKKRRDGPRVLKVFTNSESRRDQFLSTYYKNRPIGAERSFCQRDLTITEQKIDGMARKEAFRRNLTTGEWLWMVRNLELIQLPGPTYYVFHPTTASKATIANSPAPQEASLLAESSQRSSKLPIPLDVHVSTVRRTMSTIAKPVVGR